MTNSYQKLQQRFKALGYEIWLDSHKDILNQLLFARKNFAFGAQYDYFDHPDVIGWTRLGSEQHPNSMAVIMSDGPEGSKWMEVGKPNAIFQDIPQQVKEPIQTNADGWGEFRCKGGPISVWVERRAIADINSIARSYAPRVSPVSSVECTSKTVS